MTAGHVRDVELVGGGMAHCHYLWLGVTVRVPLSFFGLGLELLCTKCTKKQSVCKWYLCTCTSEYIKMEKNGKLFDCGFLIIGHWTNGMACNNFGSPLTLHIPPALAVVCVKC